MSNAAEKEVTTLPSLSVNFSDHALVEMKSQREQLRKFIHGSLQKDVDYGVIPGTPKPSLYKPGAEKLGKLFALGSRITDKTATMDREKNFAMFSYTVEVFHLATGIALAQCEGSANSQEKKWASRKDYKTGQQIPTPIGDILNTLQKMAQKRAFVGAMILATGASDFFTQDLEDMPREEMGAKAQAVSEMVKKSPEREVQAVVTPVRPTPAAMVENIRRAAGGTVVPEPKAAQGELPSDDGGDFVVPFGKQKGMSLRELTRDEIEEKIDWVNKKAHKPLSKGFVDFLAAAEYYLANEVFQDDAP